MVVFLKGFRLADDIRMKNALGHKELNTTQVSRKNTTQVSRKIQHKYQEKMQHKYQEKT